VFHPAINPYLFNLDRNPHILKMRASLEPILLNDRLNDEMGRKVIGKVEVWENERFDGTVPGAGKGGVWGGRYLRGGERDGWVRVEGDGPLWDEKKGLGITDGTSLRLGLKEGWDWVEGEVWKVDVNGLWSEGGVDEGDAPLYVYRIVLIF
jgi:hypothetical protein